MKRYRRTNVLAVFCALTSVFLILHGCGGGGDGGGGGPVAATYGISGQATLTGSGLLGVTMALSGASSGNAITDASGNYAFTGLDNGSYTITPSKTGFTFSPTSSSQTVSGANITSVNFIATSVASAFSQADLTGTWDLIQFQASSQAPGGGWFRVVGRFDESGHLIVDDNTTFQSTNAEDFVPNGDSGLVWTVDSAGVITQTGDPGTSAFHATMASNKHLIIATLNQGSTDKAIAVLRKRGIPGVTYGSMDLANKTFTNHWLDTGADNTWGYAAGTTTILGDVIITSRVFPSGPDSPPFPSPLDLVVSQAGIVTDLFGRSFYGLMTDDKKVIFYIATAGINTYEFGVFTITGQTYTQSDYSGTWNFATIRNTPPYWNYGVSSVDAAGTGTYLSFTDSAGSPTPANYTRLLSATGVITDPANATAHGQLSYNKEIAVRTQTTSGRYQITIGFK